MSRSRPLGAKRVGKPAWFLAATLPSKTPRCRECGRPALDAANRETVRDHPDSPDASPSTSYRHRRCELAPPEVRLRVTDEARIGDAIEEGGVAYIVTDVAFVTPSSGAPPYWEILGTREPIAT